MARLIALMITSSFLGSCSSVSGGVVGDYAPTWLGGTPKGVPPRPGTPEYDAFMKAQQAEADRDKSEDPASPKAELSEAAAIWRPASARGYNGARRRAGHLSGKDRAARCPTRRRAGK